MSELRQDPVSGDWVIIAPARAARPKFLDAPKQLRKPAPRAGCPFEFATLKKSDQWPPLAEYPDRTNRDLDVLVVPNKYPAVTHSAACSIGFHRGIYFTKTGIGNHELIIARDHNKNFADIDPVAAANILEIMQDRCRASESDGCSEYAVPFFNWGSAAGASIWHPHYQLLSLPAVPTHITSALENAKKYSVKHGACLRCAIVRQEKRDRVRVIEENTGAIAIAPYASKVPFEIMILPKRHASYFRNEKRAAIRDVAKILGSVMLRLRRYANDPDVNVFIHDAPLNRRVRYDYHHWHVEILPRISIPAGFEFSTGMYIDQVEPEAAATILRGKK